MRKRYFTSHRKLPALILCLCFCSLAFAKKQNNDEINIVCYAAKNKWICAPDNQKELANKESKIINQESNQEKNKSNVVIKKLNRPKFSSSELNIPKQSAQTKYNQYNDIDQDTNPYDKLWSYQLIGVSTAQNAINFVTSHGFDKKDILIVKSIHKNMDWWIVLHGLYKDKETGNKDKINLPNSINKFWLRPLKNLIINGYIDEF